MENFYDDEYLYDSDSFITDDSPLDGCHDYDDHDDHDDFDDNFDPHERDPYYSEYTDDGYYDEVDFY